MHDWKVTRQPTHQKRINGRKVVLFILIMSSTIDCIVMWTIDF